MSKLTQLVGRGGTAARPHAVLHGRLSDKFVVVYKPASLPLYTDEIGGDSLAKRLSDRVSFSFPVPLAREEEGLQIATPIPSVARTLERAHKQGFFRFGYSALVTPPRCVDLGALATRLGPPADAHAAPQGMRMPCSHIARELQEGTFTFSTAKARSERQAVFHTPQGPNVGRLFEDATADAGDEAQQRCVGCTCNRRDTINVPSFRTVKGTLHAVHDAEVATGRRSVAYNISSNGSGDEVRRLLSYHNIPVVRDFRYNFAYHPAAVDGGQQVELLAASAAAGGAAGEQETLQLREHYHHWDTMHSAFAMGTGLARSALAFPDPTVRRNATLLFGADTTLTREEREAEMTLLQIGVPRPPAWDCYLNHQLVDHSLQWAQQQVTVTWSHNPKAEGTVVKADDKAAHQARKLCLHCASTGHTVDECPKLNSASRADRVQMQLSTMAGLQGKGLYCVLCHSRDHAVQGCDKRKRGVDPKTHCAFCGSPYHSVFDCKDAQTNGLASIASADAFAQEAGFPTYKDFVVYQSEARLARLAGRRESYRIVQHGDASAGAEVDEGTLLPAAPALRREVGSSGLRRDKNHKRRKWVASNIGSLREARREQAQRTRNEHGDYARSHGGIDWSYPNAL